MFQETHESKYYLENKDQILQDAEKLFAALRVAAAGVYGLETAQRIEDLALKRFGEMLPGLPYIGGRQNRLTGNLISGAQMLCFFLEMKSRGKPVEEAGEILYNAVRALVNPQGDPRTPTPDAVRISDLCEMLQRSAEGSQRQPYAYGWYTRYIMSDGMSFDWGLDYSTCGIQRLFSEHSAQEMLPYLCFLDLPLYKAKGIGLVRTKTLSHGSDCCDFRFNLRGEYRLEWVPTFYRETDQ